MSRARRSISASGSSSWPKIGTAVGTAIDSPTVIAASGCQPRAVSSGWLAVMVTRRPLRVVMVNTGFTPSSTLFSGTLAGLVAANAAYGSGLSSWTPTAAAQARTYRFTYTLDASTPDAQQGATATATFQWEARTS